MPTLKTVGGGGGHTFWLVLAFALMSCAFTTHVQAASFTSRESGPWSDPATWGAGSQGIVPSARDQVFIASGTRVVLDVGAPFVAVESVSVQGGAVLTCPPSTTTTTVATSPTLPLNLALQVALLRIEGGGCFSCGYGDCTSDPEPFQGTFTLRLRSNIPPAASEENDRTLLVEDGGALFLNGAARGVPIVRLGADADVGQTRLSLRDSDLLTTSWRPGDRIAIAPTDHSTTQTEYHTIVSIGGGVPEEQAQYGSSSMTLLQIADALQYARSGRVIQLTNRADNNRQVDLDTRAEIALLSRNIVIEGADDAASGLGGDLMMVGANTRARLQWVEIRRMGRRGHLGRYPLHIHNLGEGGNNVYVANVAIHSSYQRGIVVHCTNGVALINNTVAGTHGFGYMLEDGAEERNVLVGNYAIDIRPSALTAPLIQTERVNPAGFWFANPANTWVRNVAAGVAGAGFSFDLDLVLASRPATLTTCRDALPRARYVDSPDDDRAFNKAVYTALMRKRFVKFEDNVVHSAFSGLWMTFPFMDVEYGAGSDGGGYNPGNATTTTPVSGGTPAPLPQQNQPETTPSPQMPITRFTAWKIGFRPFERSIDLTDGVKLVFEACVHMRGPRRVRIEQLTCVNSQNAAWSTMAATYDGATIGWLSDRELKPSGVRNPSPSSLTSTVLAYMQPQLFSRTQLFGNVGLISTAFKGQRLSTLNVMHTLSVDAAAYVAAATAFSPPLKSPSPLITLLAGDLQAFTDKTGEAFGAGPGAVVASPCVGCTGLDPLVEAHAPGRCTAAVGGATTTSFSSVAAPSQQHVLARGVLPSGRIIAARGGAVPVLCYGGNAGDPVRFAVLNLESAYGATEQRPLSLDLGVQVEAIVGGMSLSQTRRVVESLPMLVTLTASSMSPAGGGYRLTFFKTGGQSSKQQVPSSLKYLDLSLAPTTRPDDGLTLVLSGVVGLAGMSHVLGSASDLKMVNGTSASCTSQLLDPALGCRRMAAPLPRRVMPRICACRVLDVPGGETMVRFNAGPQPQYFGLYTAEGSERPLYASGRLRVFL